MESTNINSDLSGNSNKGIFFLLAKNKLFVIAILVVAVVFAVVVFFSSKTPGGFSPFQSSSTQEGSGSQVFSQDKYLHIDGVFDKTTYGLVIYTPTVVNGKYLKTPKSSMVGYKYTDIGTVTQIRVGMSYNQPIRSEVYFLETKSSGNLVPISLSFPYSEKFNFHVSGPFDNLITQRYIVLGDL